MTLTKTRWLLVGLVCLATAAYGQGSPWETYMAAGDKAYHEGDYPEAVKEWVAAVKEAEGFGPQDPRLATSLNDLGEVYLLQGRYAEAEPLLKRALAIRRTRWGRSIQKWRRASTTWRRPIGTEKDMRRPSRSTSGRWRSGEGPRGGPS